MPVQRLGNFNVIMPLLQGGAQAQNAAPAPSGTSAYAVDSLKLSPSGPLGGAAAYPKPSVVSMPSPNFNQRPPGTQINTIVLHHTASDQTAKQVGDYFKNPSAQVSSHYTIGKDGTIVQSVPDAERAWHAGTSQFDGQQDVNNFSLGIEMVNSGNGSDPFTDAQYAALAKLVLYMQTTYNIPWDRVTGHKDVALPKGRKIDPANNFSYDRLHQEVAKLQKADAPPVASKPAPAPAKPASPAPQPAPAKPAAPPPPVPSVPLSTPNNISDPQDAVSTPIPTPALVSTPLSTPDNLSAPMNASDFGKQIAELQAEIAQIQAQLNALIAQVQPTPSP